jgi:hypothetical protein
VSIFGPRDKFPTLYCWVVFIDKVALNELNRQAGLSNATSAHNDQFVFSKKLSFDQWKNTRQRQSNRALWKPLGKYEIGFSTAVMAISSKSIVALTLGDGSE